MTAVPPRPAAPECTCELGFCTGDSGDGGCELCTSWLDPELDCPAAPEVKLSGLPYPCCNGPHTSTASNPYRHSGTCEHFGRSGPGVYAAPDATAGDELRERAEAICIDMPGLDYDDGGVTWHRQIDYIEAALRDVLAAAARDAEKVRVVRELLDGWDDFPTSFGHMQQIRRALDGTS